MTRFQFVHTRRRRNPVTVAYVVDGSNTVTLAASFCSPLDRFNRARGRQIAEARLNRSQISFQVVQNDDETFNQAVSRHINTYIRRHSRVVMEQLCVRRDPGAHVK